MGLPPGAIHLARLATIVADDYGIGRATSQGILEVAELGRITATVLIVNCPDAEQAVTAWRAAGPPADLGWHPNLTLDQPVLPPGAVRSLVRPDGTFWPLPSFLRRVCLGRIRAADVRAEWTAQLRRFIELVGAPPPVVNSHQHASLFGPCRAALAAVLREAGLRPYLRRVVEPVRALVRVPGARVKRLVLSAAGQRAAARGLPGCDWLAGVTDPPWVDDPCFWDRWLRHLPTGSVELCCHPGHPDPTLVGRDCPDDRGLRRRTREYDLLRSGSVAAVLAAHGLTPIRPSRFPDTPPPGRPPGAGS